MDPRLKALIEIRELLEAEGWASPHAGLGPSALSTTSPRRSPRQLMVAFLCAVSILTNIFLLASQHDASERVVDAQAIFAISFVKESLKESTLINGADLFLTVDGQEVWRRSHGTFGSLESKESVPVVFNARCVVQLWRDHSLISGMKERPELIDQAFVSVDQAGEKPVAIDLKADAGSHYQLTARVIRSQSSSSR